MLLRGPVRRSTSCFGTSSVVQSAGSGFGSFDSVYRQFEPRSLLSVTYLNEAHNDPLQIVIEGGIAAFALLLLFLSWWFRRAAEVLVRPRGRRPALERGALIVMLLLMLSSLVDYPLRTSLLAALFAFCAVELARGHLRGPSPAERQD